MSHPPPSHPHPLQPSAPSPPSPSPPSPSALICCNKPEVLWTWPTRPKEQIEVSSLQLHRGCEVGETWCGGAATEHWCADTLRLCGCCMEGRANTLMAIFILLLVWHYNTITLLTLQAFFLDCCSYVGFWIIWLYPITVVHPHLKLTWCESSVKKM